MQVTLDRMVLRKLDEDALDDSLRIWRYMRFDQFVHVLATESIWLAPLSSMEDNREGNWIKLNATRFEESFRQSYQYAADQTVISCWAASDRELLPMWDAYTEPSTGVAISTDIHSLLRSLTGNFITDDVFTLMRVEYTEEPKEIRLNPPTVYEPVLCAKYKSSDFRHEKEVRVVYSRSALNAARGNVLAYSSVPAAEGTYIRIRSIRALMKFGVYVSPRAAPWLHDTVQSVMRTYGHDPALVRRSSLSGHFEAPSAQPFQHNIQYDT